MNTELNFPQTSRALFSAVSTPIFASKYSLESSRRDLHNALLCTVLQTQNFTKNRQKHFAIEKLNFRFFSSSSSNFTFFCEFLMIFFPGFRAKFQKTVTSVVFQSNLREQIRKLPKILKSVKMIQYYSSLFNIIHSCP